MNRSRPRPLNHYETDCFDGPGVRWGGKGGREVLFRIALYIHIMRFKSSYRYVCFCVLSPLRQAINARIIKPDGQRQMDGLACVYQ